MEFDISDVELVRRPRADTVTPIDEDDMIEAACVLPQRTAAGTTPPPVEAVVAVEAVGDREDPVALVTPSSDDVTTS